MISPSIFDRFVAPFDQPLIAAAHDAGLRIVYHTCGGMMPFLERIAEMGPDAMEIFTPRSMGGDARMAEAKRRLFSVPLPTRPMRAGTRIESPVRFLPYSGCSYNLPHRRPPSAVPVVED